jgi:hypothetical protein
MANPFNHGCSPDYPEKILGASAILNDLQKHIADVTQYKPENRYIDSVEILDRISDTLDELRPMLEKAQEILQSKLV